MSNQITIDLLAQWHATLDRHSQELQDIRTTLAHYGYLVHNMPDDKLRLMIISLAECGQPLSKCHPLTLKTSRTERRDRRRATKAPARTSARNQRRRRGAKQSGR
jgi:hypothetical protein